MEAKSFKMIILNILQALITFTFATYILYLVVKYIPTNKNKK